jgi:DNA-directed RNA polymerase subunit RPC12/RpoP
MVDKPRRPILHLKFPPSAADAPNPTPKSAPETPRSLSSTTRVFVPTPKPAGSGKPFGASKPFGAPKAFGASKAFGAPRRAPAPAKPEAQWRCKPCGKAFELPLELADDEAVRCPSCNARLGLAADFRANPPNLARVRARAVVKA